MANKNCRNCKWAEWELSKTGRKMYGNWAECAYKVNVLLPASRWYAASELSKRVSVMRHGDEPMTCATWERTEK